RIVMSNKSQDVLEAALRVAAQKFGGRIEITGSEEFKERAARMATRLGIVVENADLQAVVVEERRRFVEWTRTPEDGRGIRPSRSPSLER
ncbi:MAG TPA: LPD7 domain-containing protein, partial [Steroidobacteraceae bacterium]|nr:LPD7 domain-containing protein [Steroidobacteraceae bacterium]